MALGPRKKKSLIPIIIIILSVVLANADAPIATYERLSSLMARADALLFQADEENWTDEQRIAWEACEPIIAALDPNAVSAPTEQQLNDLADDFEDALNNI